MARHRVVRLLSTGGTIATTRDAQSGRTAPRVDAGDLVATVAVGPGISLVAEELTRRPSWALDPHDMAAIALRASAAASDPEVDGVVVTHGTTTLEYTAFLTHLFHSGPTPVVFTGSMRRADDAAADGPANLRDAVRVAASPRARNLGVLVVFHGRLIEARRAWKAQRVDPDAFVDLSGDLGRVDARGVTIRRGVTRCSPFLGRIEPRVAVIKVVPGADGSLVRAAVASGIRGLVIEALPGVGGVPEGMLEEIAVAAARMPVVVASRAPFGRLHSPPTGGTGEPLRDLALLSAGDLTAEQAWLVLMAALGQADDPAEVRNLFESAAASRID